MTTHLKFQAEMNHIDENFFVTRFEGHQIHQTINSAEDVLGVVIHQDAMIELSKKFSTELRRRNGRSMMSRRGGRYFFHEG